MKPKTAVFLVILLLVLMGLIITRQLAQRRTGVVSPQGNAVWSTRIDKVQSMAISPGPGKGREFRFERSGEQWKIVEPIKAVAEAWLVNGMAEDLKALTYIRKFGPAGPDATRQGIPDQKLTGLDNPRWKVTLTDTGGARHVLLIGKAVPLSDGQRTYVRPAGCADTFVVAMDLAGKFDKPLSDFRDKTVLDIDKTKIAKISLAGNEKLELAKTGGRWAIPEPVSTAADSKAVEKFLDKFSHVTADQFVDNNPTDLRRYGLAPGSERLVVRAYVASPRPSTGPGTQPATTRPERMKIYGLAMGSKTNKEIYAKLLDSPSVFLVREGLAKDLQVTLDQLRDRQVMPVVVDQVVRIQLDLPTGKAELSKTDNVWRMTAPWQGNANGDAVDKMLSDLNGLRAKTIRDDVEALSRFGLDSPTGEITIHQAGVSNKRVLLIGSTSPSGEVTFLKRAASDSVAVVDTASLRPVLADPAGYWATRILKTPEGAKAQSLTIAWTGRKVELARQDSVWRMTAPLKTDADSLNVAKLLAKVSDLTAKKIAAIGEQVPKEYTRTKDRIDISFTVAVSGKQPTTAATHPATRPATLPATLPASQPAKGLAEKPRTYRLSFARLLGKTYAWVPGTKPLVVGQCYGGLWKALTAEMRDRLIWRIEPDKVAALSLLAGPIRIDLARQPQGWQYTPDPFVNIDAGKVAKFLNNIRQLQADRYVTYKAPSPAENKRYGFDKPWFTFKLTDTKGNSRTLVVSDRGTNRTANRYAIESNTSGVLLISAQQAGKIAAKLADFKE